MKITKLGHCALVLEHEGVRLLTDPGSFTVEQNVQQNIDAVLITHEHQDHLHIESLKKILAQNYGCAVVTNSAVSAVIAKEGIDTTVHVVGDGQSVEVRGIKIEGFGREHAPIYKNMGLVENTGYMVAEKFYFPGDAFHNPGKSVDILALPVAGPWMKISEAIDFALAVRPRAAFGVHDGMIHPGVRGFIGTVLEKYGGITAYVSLADGETREF